MPPYSPPPTKSTRDLPSVISSDNAPSSSFAPRRPYPNQSSRSNYDLPLSNQPQHPLESSAGGSGGNPMGGDEGAGVDSPASDFAYSTTLRRAPSFALEHTHHHNHNDSVSAYGGSNHGGAGGLLERLGEGLAWAASKVGLKGAGAGGASGDYERVGGASGGHGKERDETPSEVFARLSVEETLSHHRPTSATTGLPSSLLPHLRSTHGPNEFQVAASEHILLKFLKQIYENPLILLLLGSAVVSLLVGNKDDAISIAVAVTIVLTVGFVQEQRSEQSLQALSKLVPHYCHIIRDSQPLTLLANTLVPGDLVTFAVGDRVPADVRLISAVGLEVDESALTGETKPAKKGTEAVRQEMGHHEDGGKAGGLALSERTCVAFMGTLVRNGHGSGIVVGTGTKTEFGVIFSMMQDVEEKRTPLQISMDELAKKLSIISFAIIGVIVLIGVVQKRSWLEMFTIGVSLAVAAIPEGLPIVTTVTLALGVLRMSNRKAIVKKLPSVEALGSVSVICSDKTGTLTRNEMTVTTAYTVDELSEFDEVHPPRSPSAALQKTIQIGNICNNAFKNEHGVNVGQSTDVALLNVLKVFGYEDQRQNFNRTSEIPFNSENKYMVVSGTISSSPDAQELLYLKGSIEAVLDRCRFYYLSDSSTPTLDPTIKQAILTKASLVASKGLRVVAMAYGFGSAEGSANSGSLSTTELVFAGFQAMLDPPRRGVADAIAALQTAGIHVVMITGDAEQTAMSIARDLGLKLNAGTSSCLTGKAIDLLSERQLQDRVANVTVFARVTPRHKMVIIAAFQARGAVVAMTGDGVNDAPALKMADIGISMGKSGTDVAKEAADVILVDDNFATILPAVEEGKSIFYNIQNFLVFQLSTAVAALSIITISTAFGMTNPLNAMQILFINILMDGPPAQALGVDPVDRAIMRKPPRPKNAPILTARLFARVIFSASIIVVGTLFMYLQQTIDDGGLSRRDQTMTFTTFVFLDLASAIQNRGLGCRFLQNRMLFLTCSVSFFAQLGLIYIPLMQGVFQTEALSGRDLVTVLSLGVTSLTLHEFRRIYERGLSAKEDREMERGEGGMA